MADVASLHRRACEAFADTVARIRADQWEAPTPCVDWNVRELVNHVVGEDLWTVPLLRGATVAEVGNRFDGDVLGSDPAHVAETASKEAVSAVSEPGALDRTVHLSYGEANGADYAWQLFADHFVHTWDLTRAIGRPDLLDADMVEACAAWFADWEEIYRGGGVVGPRDRVPADADASSRLLAMFGRSPAWTPGHGVIDRLNAALSRGDLDAVMALMTDDCVFEDTTPPDGRRHEGQAAVRAAWEELLATTQDPHFEMEDIFVCGDRAVQQWVYHWTGDGDGPDHVHGVDVMRLRDGRVAVKQSYVKG